MAKKNNSIAVQGAKGIGKDFFAEVFKKILADTGIDYKRYAFADVLKIMSYTDTGIEGHSSMDYDYDYLKKDYDKCKTDEFLLDRIYDLMDNVKKAKFLGIFKRKFIDLNDDDKLFLIELFKNVPDLSTRAHLRTFSDFVKEKTGDAFFFSDRLMDKIHLDNGNFDSVINTDPRYLVEIINLLINDFFLIKLVNDDISDKFLGIEHREHVSETELSLNQEHLGLVLNITGTGDKAAGKIRRQKAEELELMIKTELLPVLSKFEGYSADFKNQINRLKTLLRDDTGILDLRNEYSKLYKARLDIIKEGKTDPTPVENKLKEVYGNYCEHRDKYYKTLKSLLDSELSSLIHLDKIESPSDDKKKKVTLNKLS